MSLFSYKSYKKFMADWISKQPRNGHGQRRALAEATETQTSFVSKVLNEDVHWSLEQALKAANFFGLTDAEKHFFILLVQRERASTNELQQYFKQMIDVEVEKRQEIKNRMELQKVPSELDHKRYFSSWIYVVIHSLCLIHDFSNPTHIAHRLGLPESEVQEVLNFLIESGVIERRGTQFITGQTHFHLEKGSPFFSQFRIHSRLKALERIEKQSDGLHYTSFIGISEKDYLDIHEQITQFIMKTKKTIESSESENVFGFNVDLYRV